MSDKVRILLAEDNPADAYLVEEALSLTSIKCDLTRAPDGEVASQLLSEHERTGNTFDLILLDLNLPKISGFDLLKQIRTSQEFKATPVIVITSSDSPQDRMKTSALQIDHYFRKPINLSDFLALGNIIEAVFHTQNQKKHGAAGAG